MSLEILFLSNRPPHPCSQRTASCIIISPRRFLSSEGQTFPGFWSSQESLCDLNRLYVFQGLVAVAFFCRKINLKSSPYYVVSVRVAMEKTASGWLQSASLGQDRGHSLALLIVYWEYSVCRRYYMLQKMFLKVLIVNIDRYKSLVPFVGEEGRENIGGHF